EVETDPTCDHEGLGVYTAEFTNDVFETQTKEVVLPKLDHVMSHTPAKTVTCTEDGNVEYWYCSGCKKYYSNEEGTVEIDSKDIVIEALGHDWNDPTYAWSEDNEHFICTAEKKCKNNTEDSCIITETVTINKADMVVKTKATCTSEGLGVYTAEFDNEAFETQTKEVVIPKTEHVLKHTPAKAATCTEDGNIECWYCSGCEKYYRDAEGNTEIDRKDAVIEALGHDWNETTYVWSENNEQFICTAEKKCNNNTEDSCNISETVTIAKVDMVVKTEATCTNDGVGVYTAEFTNEAFETQTKEVVIPKLEHVMSHTPAKTVTCSEDGNVEYWYCSGCKKYYTNEAGTVEIDPKDIVIKALGHDWNDPTYVWSKDNEHFICTAEKKCINNTEEGCTITETVTIDKDDMVVKTEATCTNDGVGVYTAEFNNEVFETQTKEVVIPKLKHEMTHTPAKDVTCSDDGNVEYWYCSGCEKYYSDEEGTVEIDPKDIVIKALGHDWNEPTYVWTEDGDNLVCTAEKKCNNNTEDSCIITEVVTINKDDMEINYSPTCTNSGIGIYTAEFKKDVFETQIKEVDIPKLGHDMIHFPAKEATCEENGNIEYYKCKRCEALFEDEEGNVSTTEGRTVIKAKGHDWGEWIETKPATESEDGEEMRICNNDPSHIEIQPIPHLTHVHKYRVIRAKEPTCETAGNVEYYQCDGCKLYFLKDGDKYTKCNIEDATIKATGHKPKKVEQREPNCSETGCLEHFKCTVCKKLFDDDSCNKEIKSESVIIPIDENAHDFSDVSYIWSDDYSTVTAIRVCLNNLNHEEKETVKTTFAVVKEAGDMTDGLGIYITEKFDNEAFEIQTKEVTILAKGISGNDEEEVVEEKAVDGTDVGPGASETLAEKAITNSPSDEGPEGSVFGLLQARMKKRTRNSITLTWKKISGAKYVVYGNQCGRTRKFDKITTVYNNRFIERKLMSGTYYKYIIVAVKNGKVVSTSKTLHIATKGGKYTNHSKVKINKKKVNLKLRKTFRIKTKLVKQNKKLRVQNHRKVKYESSNTSVATVNKKGKIKAVGRGTAYVYAYAQDGVMAKVKVTVK
ncbi:MAG: Ig-like domain-containing protein, partial [Eubacterium sp.]|nr:Ig-like domain-containing protein [Eubacterium sp.]